MSQTGGGDRSPYELLLGESLAELHPRLRTYFSAIPQGMVGVGRGVFTAVGTPRRWLWPVLALLAADGIVFPVWERGVDFVVRNSPRPPAIVDGRREFRFHGASRVMIDAISCENGQLVDRLGHSGRILAELSADVDQGALRLRSTAVSILIWRRRLRLPRVITPTVSLVERFDDRLGMQEVAVVLEHPILGRLYEYAGQFTYELRSGE